MKMYSKKFIIDTVIDMVENHLDMINSDSNRGKVISDRAWLDRLNKSIGMLQEDKILNSKKIKDGDYCFFIKQVNLEAQIEKIPREKHTFEPVATVFLIAFLVLYEHPFTKSYFKQEFIKEEYATEWFEKIEIITEKIAADIIQVENHNFEFWLTNIISQFLKLSRREIELQTMNKDIDKYIIDTTSRLLALKEVDKVILYQEKMEKVYEKINIEIENIIGKYNSSEIALFEFDTELNPINNRKNSKELKNKFK